MINYKLYNKDCRSMVELPDNSIHAVCTSPPYWGLRKYSGEQDLIWGDNHCQHEWGDDMPRAGYRSNDSHPGKLQSIATQNRNIGHSNICSLCGAWKGSYGLEPTPELYIQHSVEILREIRRVLRKDGVVFWNIADSMASGKGTCFNPGGGKGSFSTHGDRKDAGVYPLDRGNVSLLRASGLKPLDLCLIPERLALALQADGWWVRSIIIWHKPNPMPESVNGWRWEQHKVLMWPDGTLYKHERGKDRPTEIEMQDCPGCPKCSPNDGLVLRKGSWRPTDSYEQILMLTKTNNYYCDAEAVKQSIADSTIGRGPVDFGGAKGRDYQPTSDDPQYRGGNEQWGRTYHYNGNGRNLRNVWSFATVPFPSQIIDGEKLDHFAAFPPKLPEMCIKAATPEKGVCAKCGAPWARVIEKGLTAHDGKTDTRYEKGMAANRLALLRQAARERGEEYTNKSKTIGWRPTCSCNCPETVPATVLDPFAGAGTTLLEAIELGRNAVGYEISPGYCKIIKNRINEVQIKLS